RSDANVKGCRLAFRHRRASSDLDTRQRLNRLRAGVRRENRKKWQKQKRAKKAVSELQGRSAR
ncbi:MAG: hypothetical protein OXD00_06135, partial [Gammaproteobacteria bacterium]|nr:hypothetical protein [Gammaproteobacteria bacterium]